MKVGLNATCLNDRPSGAKQRFIGICSELFQLMPNDQFVIYEPVDCRVGDWFDGVPNVRVRRTPLPSHGRIRRNLTGLWYWQRELLLQQFDIFECFNLPLVKAPTGFTLLTVHDIRGMAPGAPALERFAYRMFLRNSIEAADHVITVSEAMKNDILALFPKIDISVIYNGINAAKFHALTDVDIQSTQQRLELPGEFVMAVGHLEPRKNYLSLVKAMAILRNQGRPTHLIIIGNDSGELAAIEYAVKEAKLQGMVKILSDISDKDIHCCYKLCSLFVFPSTYEGFGIPILEAMAVGCPMALSDLPVFRELTQNRGLYFPPDKVADMAAVIELGLESSTERYRLVEYGHERIGQFGFHQLAVELERYYRSLATKSAELRSRYDETKGLNGQEYRP